MAQKPSGEFMEEKAIQKKKLFSILNRKIEFWLTASLDSDSVAPEKMCRNVIKILKDLFHKYENQSGLGQKLMYF